MEKAATLHLEKKILDARTRGRPMSWESRKETLSSYFLLAEMCPSRYRLYHCPLRLLSFCP